MNKKILVAEDERPMARALELKLETKGFDVDIANDGAEALTKIKENTYDLILLDIMMPQVNGFDVLKDMKTQGKTTPVIVMSNLMQEDDKEKVTSLGARMYISKADTPISAIVDKVTALLQSESQ